MLVALLLALGAAVPPPATPPPPLRFACDPIAGTLGWERDDATLRASDAGLELDPTRIASPARPLAPAASPPAIVVPTPDGPLTLRGVQVERCKGRRCSPVTRSPVSVWAAVPDGPALLIAGGAPRPGLYRAALSHLDAPELLVSGEVLTLCPGTDGAWALVMHGPEATLVGARADSPTVTTLSFDEALLLAARGGAPVGALRRAFDSGGATTAASRRLALVVARDPRPEARAAAATALAADPAAVAAAELELLAGDPSPEVREAALEALVAARSRLAPADAAARLFAFVGDPAADLSWRARDGLLDLAPELALLGASRAYKLDAVSILASRAARSGISAVRDAVRLLGLDEDPVVRGAAVQLEASVEP